MLKVTRYSIKFSNQSW